jgi:4-hydroxybenzoate polyprenyltransferase
MMIENIKKLFFVSRPISWINTAYPFAGAYLVSGGIVNPLFIVATLYFLVPYNLLMYGVNDVFDYESDIQNPRKGGIEGMREQRVFHPTIIISSIILNIPFIIALIFLGNIQGSIGLIVLIFFVVAYSMRWLRFKERPVIDSATSSIHFAGPAIYALLLTGFSSSAWPFIIALFLWGMASHALGAVQDILPDRAAKIASIATVLGARTTIRLVIILYTSASIIVILQGFPYSIIGITGLIYVINTLFYICINDKKSLTVNRAWRRFIWLNMITGFVVTIVLLTRLTHIF